MPGKDEAHGWLVRGKPVTCLVCESRTFWLREAQLNTPVATFFGFDWANKTAQCLVCSACGFVHWFVPLADAELTPAYAVRDEA